MLVCVRDLKSGVKRICRTGKSSRSKLWYILSLRISAEQCMTEEFMVKYKWRQRDALPVMRIIRKKLDRMAADSRLLPKTEKYEAVHYMLNEWDALMNIFTRGDYHLDNNLVERLNRYISLSRRNSLFFGSHAGARRAAMFYSLACSCRLQGVNFFE